MLMKDKLSESWRKVSQCAWAKKLIGVVKAHKEVKKQTTKVFKNLKC